ncbi:hypothetical protein Tco_1463971, partial [Tanacetum coccineum]
MQKSGYPWGSNPNMQKSWASTNSNDVYPVFADPYIFTQADGAQSFRVPVPLPEDPYEAISEKSSRSA